MRDIDELIAVLRDKIDEHGCELQISLLITNGIPCGSVIELETVSTTQGFQHAAVGASPSLANVTIHGRLRKKGQIYDS